MKIVLLFLLHLFTVVVFGALATLGFVYTNKYITYESNVNLICAIVCWAGCYTLAVSHSKIKD